MEIYLDNAATTRVCPEAAQAAADAMLNSYGNPNSTHAKGREAKKLMDSARKSVASALGCAPQELFFHLLRLRKRQLGALVRCRIRLAQGRARHKLYS